MKKILSVIAIFLIAAAVLWISLPDKEDDPGESANVTDVAVQGSNSLGVTYTAFIESVSENAESGDRTVAVAIKASKKVDLDSLGGIVAVPDGFRLIAVENEDLGFSEQYYNTDNGYLAYYTPDAENVHTDYLARIVYAVPNDLPAGEYVLGLHINCISKDYGEVWENAAIPTVAFTVE